MAEDATVLRRWWEAFVECGEGPSLRTVVRELGWPVARVKEAAVYARRSRPLPLDTRYRADIRARRRTAGGASGRAVLIPLVYYSCTECGLQLSLKGLRKAGVCPPCSGDDSWMQASPDESFAARLADPFEAALLESVQRKVNAARVDLGRWDPRRPEEVRAHFEDDVPQREIAESIGVSRERVRQHLADAYRKLRKDSALLELASGPRPPENQPVRFRRIPGGAVHLSLANKGDDRRGDDRRRHVVEAFSRLVTSAIGLFSKPPPVLRHSMPPVATAPPVRASSPPRPQPPATRPSAAILDDLADVLETL